MEKYENLHKVVETDSGNYGATRKFVQDIITRDRSTGVAELLAEILIKLDSQNKEISTQADALSDFEDIVGLLKLPLSVNPSKGVMYADKISTDARMGFKPSQGFSDLEYLGDGTPYRWTSGKDGQATIKSLVRRISACEVTLCVVNSGLVRTGGVKQIVLVVNGEQVNLIADNSRVEVDQTAGVEEIELIYFTGALPALEENEPTIISINFPTWRPCDLDEESMDDRLLGVAFVSLEIDSGSKEND